MKHILASLAFICSPVYAVITPLDIASAISCNSDMNNGYYMPVFTKQYGTPYKFEGGAAWFHASGELYGAQIKDVFVSSIKEYNFVGVVLDGPPEPVIEQIRTSRMIPTTIQPVENQGWVGADGRKIMWHEQKNTKIFCFGGGIHHS
jgi:hypothetical protein